MNRTLFGEKRFFYHLFNLEFCNDNYLMLDIPRTIYREEKHDKLLENLNKVTTITLHVLDTERISVFK